MTVSEARANPDTVSGIMIIFGTLAQVLFYSKSSKSFISSSFALQADRELSPLKHKLVVITPLGEQILRNFIFKGCEILIKGVVLKTDLIPLEIWDFDVILGMDWLSTPQAWVDFFTKTIVFQKPGFPKLKFVGDPRILPTYVISTLETKRLLHKGCEAYLAYVVDKSTSKVTLESVSIVWEFLDVFPEDLPSLPPDQELKFGIELLPRSTFISIPPYRMTLAELKELKTQLQDLVDKGLIWPSVLP